MIERLVPPIVSTTKHTAQLALNTTLCWSHTGEAVVGPKMSNAWLLHEPVDSDGPKHEDMSISSLRAVKPEVRDRPSIDTIPLLPRRVLIATTWLTCW